jgi:hypothetical protein
MIRHQWPIELLILQRISLLVTLLDASGYTNRDPNIDSPEAEPASTRHAELAS